jgi:hypothetical protein
MATRKTTKQNLAVHAASDAPDLQNIEDALFAEGNASLEIVRAAGITNGMEPVEIRRRIVAAVIAAKG